MITRATDIQIGERTHTQLHVITLHNFKTINAIVNNPTKLIPPDLDVVDDLFELFCVIYISSIL